MNKATCIVVGAGPAGCSAACHLARSGVDVLVLERADEGRDKVCGDGLSPAALRELTLLGLHEPVVASANGVRGAGVCGPNGRAFEVEHPSLRVHVMRRQALDGLLLGRARELGAQVRTCVAVRELQLQPDGVRAISSTGEVFEARYVVLASGSHSPLPIQQGLQHRPPADAVARRAYWEGVNQPADRLLFCYAQELLPGYGWVFPLGSGAANIGVGYFLSEGKPDLDALAGTFERWLRNAGILPEGSRPTTLQQTALLRVGFRRNAIAGGRVLLAGDAAASITPLTGEGISQALLTGRVAHETLREALAHGAEARPELHRDRVRRALPTMNAYGLAKQLFRSASVVNTVVASARGSAAIGRSVFETIVGERDPRLALLHVATGVPRAAWRALRSDET